MDCTHCCTKSRFKSTGEEEVPNVASHAVDVLIDDFTTVRFEKVFEFRQEQQADDPVTEEGTAVVVSGRR